MEISIKLAACFIIIVIIGIILAKLAGFIGSEIFRFSELPKFFLKLLKKSADK